MDKEKPKAVVLPLEWHFPDTLISRYATNLVIQHTDHEFILSFFDAPPPPFIGPPDAQKAQLEALTTIKAECVARIIVAGERMEGFINALQKNLESYKSLREKE